MGWQIGDQAVVIAGPEQEHMQEWVGKVVTVEYIGQHFIEVSCLEFPNELCPVLPEELKPVEENNG